MTSGWTASARNTKPLLLAAREAQGAVRQAVLHFFPQACALQAQVDEFIECSFVSKTMEARTVCDVFKDRLRKGIGLLEDHAHAFPQLIDIHPRFIDVGSIEFDASFNFCTVDKIV